MGRAPAFRAAAFAPKSLWGGLAAAKRYPRGIIACSIIEAVLNPEVKAEK